MTDFKPNSIDKKLIAELQENLPLTSRPFAEVADNIGIEEKEVINRLKRLKEAGVLRRIAPLVAQEKSGFRNNAMVVWQVPGEKCDSTGEKLASFKFISHCYQRPTAPDWPYQIFTVVHARDEKDLQTKLEQLENSIDYIDWRVLRTEEKLKKASLRYF